MQSTTIICENILYEVACFEIGTGCPVSPGGGAIKTGQYTKAWPKEYGITSILPPTFAGVKINYLFSTQTRDPHPTILVCVFRACVVSIVWPVQ